MNNFLVFNNYFRTNQMWKSKENATSKFKCLEKNERIAIRRYKWCENNTTCVEKAADINYSKSEKSEKKKDKFKVKTFKSENKWKYSQNELGILHVHKGMDEVGGMQLKVITLGNWKESSRGNENEQQLNNSRRKNCRYLGLFQKRWKTQTKSFFGGKRKLERVIKSKWIWTKT